MCGRIYSTYTEEELSARYFNRRPIRMPALESRYNTAPSQNLPVLRRLTPRLPDDSLQLDLFRWGLVPSWAEDIKIGYKMINARAETLSQKPSFRQAFQKRRCVVPVSGFYEWKRLDAQTKQPFAIRLGAPGLATTNQNIMSLAGIWETWQSKSGDAVHSFSIITTSANSVMAKIHDRMPVILAPEQETTWLDPEIQDLSLLQTLLNPCPPEWLEAFEVSQLVNNPRNNRPENLVPLNRE